MVVNGQYDITNITDRSSVNSVVTKTERPAAPSRVAGDNGFESNLKPSTYRADMANQSQDYKSNVYTREQVFRKRSEAASKTGDSTKNQAARMQSDRQVQELQMIEREVIAHEQAHMSAGGQYAGNATYSYTEGPDGKRYITGGEVSINAPAGKDAEETARIMAQVKRAALAPANPSSQDIKVASRAAAVEQAALREQAIDRSLQDSQTLRQEIQATFKEQQTDQTGVEQSQVKVEDAAEQQKSLRLNRQAGIAENQVRAEERNLDAVAIEETAIQQDYERKLMEYQRIMQQVNNLKSSITPSAKAVNMVA